MTEEAFVFPASFAQARLWFFDQLETESALYNMPIAVRLTGPLQADLLERSLNVIVRRHEALRTTFPTVDGQPVQVVKPSLSLMLPVVDLRELPEVDREREAQALAAAELRRPFDLAHGPLLRVSLLRLSAENHILTLAMHHIVGDGWSLGVLLRELAALYEAFFNQETPSLPELPIQYADYAVWQRDWLQEEVLESQLDYWSEQLAGVPALELPSDHTRPETDTFQGARQAVTLPKALATELKLLSRREGVTLFMTLLTAFNVLLYRYTGQEDIAIGSPIAGRNLDEVKDLIGFFVNTLVLRTDLSGNPSFSELLGRVRQVCLDAFSHQDVPFERLVHELQPERDLDRNPLFQVMFALQNAPMPPMKLAGLTLRPLELHTGTSRFDLTIEVWETSEGLRGLVEYNTDLFEAATIAQMLAHYERLLEGAVADAGQHISDLPLLSSRERQQLLGVWNDTVADYPRTSCVHELFEAQAELTPDAVAVTFDGTSLTYRELNRRANYLAHYLQGLGVGPEALVGLCVTRSLEMVVGLLGILKAGGAYVPLDASYPQERLAYMLKDTQVRVLLTQERLAQRFSSRSAHIVQLDADWEEIARQAEHNPQSDVAPENLAYVIYTSGSTGRPKGVLLRHSGLCNLVTAQTQAFDVQAASRVLQFASFSFDASVSEIFMALVTGAALHLAAQDTLMSGPDLLRLLRSRAITTVTLPPSVLRILSPEGLPALQTLVSAGEVCDPEIVRRWSPGRRFINAYGPTEATIGPTLCVVEDLPADATSVPIGRPILNTQIYLLDAHLQPVPPGVPGELHIGGVGLARGYLNRPDLTAESFIPDPFSEESGARLYRTGDLARCLPDGTLEFLGRKDHQVKVRGFRVELGEIEAVLGRHPEVQEAVVLAREERSEDAGVSVSSKRLVGYVVPKDGQDPSLVAELRGALRETLPDYMVPSAFVTLEALPLTPNGKVDRRALPAPDWSRSGLEDRFVAPRNPTEEMLAGVWNEVLGLDRVGVHDSFFDLGGHSLLATQVISRLREAFQVEFPVRRFFEKPTIAGLAEEIAKARQAALRTPFPPIEAVSREEELPLSFAQQRLWFLDRLEPGSPFYNIPAAARLSGLLDVTALKESVNEIVRRHEALRTSFSAADGQPVQVVAPELAIPMPVVDLTALPEGDRKAEATRLTTAEARRPFDLAEGPLLRALLLRLGAEQHILMLTMHHIVSDNWSMGVTIRELATLYATFADEVPAPVAASEASLPELPVQYADFAHWQRQWLSKDSLRDQLAYWREQLEGLPPLLELPTDRPRPAVQTFRGANRWFHLPEGLSRRIRALSQREGTTLFMTLLAAFQVLLYRYTGQRDLCVGTPVANRNRAQIEGLIGFFVNTLVMRSDLSGDPSFRKLLQRVRDVALGAYDHQDVPFEMLVDELQPQRDLSHAALFQVMFALQNAQMEPLELPGLSLSPMELDTGTAKFDLTLSLEDGADGLTGQVNYNTALFDAATIDRMVAHWQTLLEGIVSHPEQPISQLPILPEAERQQLLVDWNDTAVAYAQDRCVHELFQAQVMRTPQAVAVDLDGQRLTYVALNRRANQLAHYLRRFGVGPETLVGVCTERSLDLVIGLLGIIKAGGAYVPLDPTYPEDRLKLMLEDAQMPIVLTQARLRDRISLFNQETVSSVCLDTDWDTIAQEPHYNPESGVTPDNLAYAIYTSGSTGRPKGTLVQHRGVCNYVPFYIHEFDLGPGDCVLQFASISFDASVPEIFGALLSGATLQLARPEVLLSPDALGRLLRDREVTFSIMPPSLLAILSNEGLSTLEILMSAGEACPPAVARNWASGRRFFNGYGPTEATVGPGLHEVGDVPKEATGVPIGRPITNIQIYVLDVNGQPVPTGVVGEVCIAGVGLARGYLHRPDLTAEKFVPNPFSDEPGARLYRTGDLARHRPDGTMAFVGRMDHQVKVRGFRVELGEVETALSRHSGVRDAVVVARQDTSGGKRLTGYVVCRQEPGPPVGELRDFLKDKLPEYMVPSVFVKLEELPLTPSGKVDRQALPVPTDERPELGTAYVTPRNKMERSIAGIWEEILSVERVGVNDNFFDLGGHSLLMAQVHGRLQQVWGDDLSMVDLFRYPTISSLADYLSRDRGAAVSFEEEGDRVSRQKEALRRQRQRMRDLARKPR